jgi:hypothetical protein
VALRDVRPSSRRLTNIFVDTECDRGGAKPIAIAKEFLAENGHLAPPGHRHETGSTLADITERIGDHTNFLSLRMKPIR